MRREHVLLNSIYRLLYGIAHKMGYGSVARVTLVSADIARRGTERTTRRTTEGLERERSLILKLLTYCVSDLSPEIIAQVQALSVEQLEALGEALLDFTQPEDLLNWLENNQNP